MAQRSRHAVSAGLEARSERPGDTVRAAPGMLHEKHGLVPFFLDTRETPASCRFSLGNLRLLVRSVASCDAVVKGVFRNAFPRSRGAARTVEPGLPASEARMAERSRHAVSAGLEARSERPGDAVRAAPAQP
jgi:hypothetical protein